MARTFNVEDEGLTKMIREGQGKIFSEDLAMLEQQQQNILAYPDRQLLRLNIDAGGFQSRRVLERLIAEEHNKPLAA
jgi:vanillate O-demethylase monooxygenase subunit